MVFLGSAGVSELLTLETLPRGDQSPACVPAAVHHRHVTLIQSPCAFLCKISNVIFLSNSWYLAHFPFICLFRGLIPKALSVLL